MQPPSYWQSFTPPPDLTTSMHHRQLSKRYISNAANIYVREDTMSHNRATGTCKTCNRKQVTLVAEHECSVCHRVAGVATKVLQGLPITASDQSTMRRVIAATQQGVTTSIEAKVAQKKGWVELFKGRPVNNRRPTAAQWPRPATGWECSDGTLVADEVTALKHELDLARGGQRHAA